MKRLIKTTLAIIVLLVLSVPGWAATYYIAMGGGGTKAQSVNYATPMSIATHNGETFADGDILLLSDSGGVFTSTLTCPSSGIAARITYGKVPGETPTFTVAGVGINTNGKNNIVIDSIKFDTCTSYGVSLGSGTTQTVTNCIFTGCTDINIRGNPGNNFTMSYCTFTCSGNSSYPFQNWVASSGMVIDHNTVLANTGTPNYCFYFMTGTSLTFSNNTIAGYTSASKLMYFNACTAVISSGNTIGSAVTTTTIGSGQWAYHILTVPSFTSTNDNISYITAGGGVYLKDSTASFTNLTTNHNVETGTKIENSTVGLDSCISNNGLRHGYYIIGTSVVTAVDTDASYNGTSASYCGWYQINSATLTATGCSANYNYEDGFSANNTGGVSCTRCIAYNNGVDAVVTSGDGYTSHDTSTMNLRRCIGYGNKKSGFSGAGASTGLVHNCSFYNNYSLAKAGNGGGICLTATSTGAWDFKSNITYNHDIELNIAPAVPGVITLDYNNYHLGANAGVGPFVYEAGSYATFALYRAAFPAQDAHSMSADPKWVSTVTPDFRLKGGSPCINAGDPATVVTPDYAGVVVPQGSYPDMGAYEHSSHAHQDLIDWLKKYLP